MSAEETQLTTRQETSLLSVIDRIVASGLTTESVAALDKLLQMQERVQAQQRKQAFIDAMVQMRKEIPQIEKDGRIVVNGSERSRFARLETIDEIIQPILLKYGFVFSLNETVSNDKRKYTMTLSHREGHSEDKSLELPLDTSGSKNSVQSVAATVSYAQRYLITMHLNLVTKGADNDGHSLETITADQVRDIETTIQDLKMNRNKFLVYMGVGDTKDILLRDIKKVEVAFQAQRDSLEAKKK